MKKRFLQGWRCSFLCVICLSTLAVGNETECPTDGTEVLNSYKSSLTKKPLMIGGWYVNPQSKILKINIDEDLFYCIIGALNFPFVLIWEKVKGIFWGWFFKFPKTPFEKVLNKK